MTQVARIRNFQRIAFRRRNELKGMSTYINVRDCLFDLWHMTRHAFATRAARRMMGVRLEGGCVRTVLCVGAVAGRANLLSPA